jgi:hypothetical protein
VPRWGYFAASAVLGLAFAVLAFAGGGGLQLDDLTRIELPLIVIGGLTVSLAILYGRRGPVSGALPLALFVALAALTGLSISWSIAPSDSWIETNRTLAYLLCFAAALVMARIAPNGWAPLLNGLMLAIAAVCFYALISRVWPDALADEDQFARISEPLGYWNAVGATAAMAVPAALWLGARRTGGPVGRALAYPLLGMLLLTILLTQSRGALLSAGIGAAAWIAFVPLRMRSLALLALAGTVAGLIAAWALSQGAFVLDGVPGVVRESVASEFGSMLVVGFALLLAAGLVVGFRQSLRAPSVTVRRRVGIALAVGVLLLPLVGVSALAASDRGLTGSISYRVQQLTGAESATAGGPERLTQVSSSRGRYWRQAGRVFSDHMLLGTGADTWGTARLRYRLDQVPAQHAHGYVPQVMSDLGLVGLLLALALGVSWLVVASRNVGLRPSLRGREWRPERIGLVAVGLVAVVYGAHSTLDWTWFVPGPTVMAMIAAGWVAGRGRLLAAAPAAAGGAVGAEGAPAGATAPGASAPAAASGAGATGAATPRPVAATGGAGTPAADPSASETAVIPAVGGVARTAGELPEAPSAGQRMGRLMRRDGWRLGLGIAALIATGLVAWSAYQPYRSDAYADIALGLIDAGRLPDAAATADRAREVDPLSPEPLFVRATVADAASRPAEAERLLQQVVRDFPADPRGYLRLGDYQLHRLNRTKPALDTLRGAVFLDPQSRAARSYFLEARARSGLREEEQEDGGGGDEGGDEDGDGEDGDGDGGNGGDSTRT